MSVLDPKFQHYLLEGSCDVLYLCVTLARLTSLLVLDRYQFKLERWTNLGVSVLAAFASEEEAEVQALHDTIAKILKSCPYGGLRNIDHMLK